MLTTWLFASWILLRIQFCPRFRNVVSVQMFDGGGGESQQLLMTVGLLTRAAISAHVPRIAITPPVREAKVLPGGIPLVRRLHVIGVASQYTPVQAVACQLFSTLCEYAYCHTHTRQPADTGQCTPGPIGHCAMTQRHHTGPSW